VAPEQGYVQGLLNIRKIVHGRMLPGETAPTAAEEGIGGEFGTVFHENYEAKDSDELETQAMAAANAAAKAATEEGASGAASDEAGRQAYAAFFHEARRKRIEVAISKKGCGKGKDKGNIGGGDRYDPIGKS
jgi:hypothetical protein